MLQSISIASPWTNFWACYYECPSKLCSDCNHVTYSPALSSAEFRWNPKHLFGSQKSLLTWQMADKHCLGQYQIFSLYSSCDSRNLNLSPFCDLSSTLLAMWQPSVLETYGNQTTTYVNQTLGPLRLKYPNLMGEKELISFLTKVLQICQPHVRFSPPTRVRDTTMPTRRT